MYGDDYHSKSKQSKDKKKNPDWTGLQDDRDTKWGNREIGGSLHDCWKEIVQSSALKTSS